MNNDIAEIEALNFSSIPNDWKSAKINEIADIKGGFAFDSTKFKEFGKYQVIKMSNLYENQLDLSRSQSFLDDLTEQEKEYVLTQGDIIITLTGTIGKRDYGYSYQIEAEENLLLNQRVAKIKVTKGDPTYVSYQIKTNRFLNQFFFSARGGTGNQANVGIQDLASMKVILPPLKEQKAIAQVLSTADSAINTTEKLIAQKELRKKWLMQQLLTGNKRLKGFGEEWKEHSYEKILKVVKRNFDWDENELYNLISVRRRSGGIFYREALYGHQILVKTLRTANEGDFLFSKMQILHGASALVTKEFDGAKISGSYIAVVPKDKKQLNMEFFQWYSQTPYFYHQTYISSYGVHIEKMTFDFDTFLQLEMKLPSIQEQTAIAQVLQAADKEISLLKAKADKLREQKKGLMQQLLTGKIRLNVNE
ncbi:MULTISPECIES: restriction endonuclease subunit S [unclassified Arcicella]|uniref:restriction endonuclease subunit S n=1 Tax=unclassified Arcicella TaxID=2644986 RepID=UPI00285E0C25|nr:MULTISPECIES: restriction endonuclease subunit S [unclassified Arcicella]MDR6563792.1 type I restriction enzyme S subunit [Arcicella sp. BE51]MDR6813524.1 type I restriction enzyme S subunit [Arcicella sp. BE140]MDR6824837.1 type I restriction enzyme S subunit [Arcicella sp. BE139]